MPFQKTRVNILNYNFLLFSYDIVHTNNCKENILSSDYSGKVRIARDDDKESVVLTVKIVDSPIITYATAVQEDLKIAGR